MNLPSRLWFLWHYGHREDNIRLPCTNLAMARFDS